MQDNLKEWDILRSVVVLCPITVPLFWITRAPVNRVYTQLQAERVPIQWTIIMAIWGF